MIRLEKIDSENVWKIVKLRVSEEQEDFVASNAESLIEAYLTLSEHGQVLPFGIYADDVPVGFLMIGYDGADCTDAPLRIAPGNYSLWRFMIDERYQRRGYGRAALTEALSLIRSFPFGEAEYCYLSYEAENETAKRLYAEFGFEENGETDGDELVAVLKL